MHYKAINENRNSFKEVRTENEIVLKLLTFSGKKSLIITQNLIISHQNRPTNPQNTSTSSVQIRLKPSDYFGLLNMHILDWIYYWDLKNLK